jgi:hypothetical protein
MLESNNHLLFSNIPFTSTSLMLTFNIEKLIKQIWLPVAGCFKLKPVVAASKTKNQRSTNAHVS